ncbi:MAG TPA: hypothetical protein VG167_09500 [Verrucomicrobiae bacterium]|nr:hypothetical protein [Verrucomicrobiae bacterium]
MKGEPTNPPLLSPTTTCTLAPILTLGAACLDHHAEPCIKDIALLGIGIAYDNSPHQELVITTDNLLDTHQPSIPFPIPSLGKLAWAKFLYLLQGHDSPHTVTVSPPATISFQFPADAHCIFHWMDRIGLRIPNNTAKQLAVLLLALATAFASGLGDGDNDDDDPTADRHTPVRTCSVHLSSLYYSTLKT